MAQNRAEGFLFGDHQVLLDQRLLVSCGIPVPLSSRAFDMLVALIERQQQIVSKAELMRRVWGGQLVEENTLAVHLSALRRALGGRDPGARYIRTVPGRGYVFQLRVKKLTDGMQRAGGSDMRDGTGSLPRAVTPLIGRDAVVDEIVLNVQRDRVTTITGAGGIGKSRAALAACTQLRAAFPDGVWWIDLAPIQDAALLPATVARILGLRLGDAPGLTQLTTGLRGRHCLLALDNCEHVIAGAAALAVAFETLDGVTLLGTSQEALRVSGERVMRLDALELPDAEAGPAPARASPAVQLFIARAQAMDRDFDLDDRNVAAVVRICRRLEGVPLALELAAAKVALLGAEPLLRRLDQRLLDLGSVRRDAPAKHQTLRALLDWSYGLLSTAERATLRRLGAFVGPWTLEAAEAVVADEIVPEWRVAELIASLIGKSLVAMERRGRAVDYRLLETTRSFARERLTESGEHAAVAGRHARYIGHLMERADADWESLPSSAWRELYGPAIEDVRAALDWAFAEPGAAAIAIAVAATSGRLWNELDLWTPGRRHVDRALALVDDDTPPGIAARLYHFAGAWRGLDLVSALPYLEKSLGLFRHAEGRSGLSRAQGALGKAYFLTGRTEEGIALLDAAYEQACAAGQHHAVCYLLHHLGVVATTRGDHLLARRHFARSIELSQAGGWTLVEIGTRLSLAEVECELGNVTEAIELVQEGIARCRQLGRLTELAISLCNKVSYLILKGDIAAARPAAEEAFALARELGDWIMQLCLRRWAHLAALEGRCADAARLLGFVQSQQAAAGLVLSGVDEEVETRLVRLLDSELPASERAACLAAGAGWTPAEAANFACSYMVAPVPTA